MTDSLTYPWLNFSLDLNRMPSLVWFLLGQCASECEHITGVPLRPEAAKRLHEVYLAKGVMATTAIEGNTLSEEEVLARVEGKKELPPSKEYLGREVDNIIEACQGVLKRVVEGRATPITSSWICETNRLVLKELKLPEEVTPGKYRMYRVTVGRYRPPAARKVPGLVRHLCDFLERLDREAGQAMPVISLGILKAIVAHLYVAWIHPFGDGNGRTARLVEFELLTQCGVPSAAAHLLSNHYNMTRTDYYRQLEEASKSESPAGFISYALRGFLDGLKQQLQVIRAEHLDIAWRNYVYEALRKHRTSAWRRRRDIVLALSLQPDPVPPEQIPLLTPDLARAYKNKGDRTLSRDLNALILEGLIKKRGKRYRANREMILAFLPIRNQSRTD